MPEDEKKIWSQDQFGYDVKNVIATMAAGLEKTVLKDSLDKEFSTLESALKKSIKHDVVDTKVATNKSFFEKLKDLAKQDPNAIVDTATGQTLLHQAITKPLSPTFTNASRIKLVSMLLQRGADITKKDKAGQTALDLAKKSGNPEILAIFDLFSPTKERTEKLIKSLTSLREQLKKLAQQLTTLKK